MTKRSTEKGLAAGGGSGEAQEERLAPSALALNIAWRRLEGVLSVLSGQTTDLFPEDAWIADVARTPEGRDRLLRWINIYGGEVELVRMARNSAVHHEPIREENVRSATEGATRLVEILKDALRQI